MWLYIREVALSMLNVNKNQYQMADNVAVLMPSLSLREISLAEMKAKAYIMTALCERYR